MVKLRLARQGRKKVPIYRIVAADSRARRDGRFIEALGQYRPSNDPGQKITLKEDRIMHWLSTGAQPSDTVRSLLSSEGVLLKWHLEKKKIEPARAAEIFNTWKAQRDARLASHVDAKVRAKEEAKRKAAAAKKAAEAPVETSVPVEASVPVETAAASAEPAAPQEPVAATPQAPEAPVAVAPQAPEAPVAVAPQALEEPAAAVAAEPERAAESVEG